MQLKIREEGSGKCAPSNRIDKMWHANILSTREYFVFCERHNRGDYLHHDPSRTDVPARYQTTWEQYSALFGHGGKDGSIWPPAEKEEEEFSEEK